MKRTNKHENSPGFSAFCSKGDNTREWSFLWKSWQLFSMWRTFIVGVFCWGQHKHLSHEAHPFLQVLPSHHLPVYVTVFKSGFMSFTDGQEQGGRRAMDTQSQNRNRRKWSVCRPSRHGYVFPSGNHQYASKNRLNHIQLSLNKSHLGAPFLKLQKR